MIFWLFHLFYFWNLIFSISGYLEVDEEKNNNISSFRFSYKKYKYSSNDSKLEYPLVTLIVCTIRYSQWKNILNNYRRQNYPNMELFVILDGISNIKRIANLSKNIKNKHVSITRIPYRSIGNCLNYGIQETKGTWIAKMDDDDYYGRKYITNLVKETYKIPAKLFIKLSHFVYFEKRKELWLLSPNHESKWMTKCCSNDIRIPGSTIFWNRKTCREYNITFKNRRVGEDLYFIRSMLQRNIPIYSTNRHDHCWIRRNNIKTHTWKINDETLIHQKRAVKIFSFKNGETSVSLSSFIEN